MRRLDERVAIRDIGICIARVVDAHRYEKGAALAHEVSALVGETPLQAEIAFGTGLCTCGNDRDEQRAVLNLFPDLLVPGVSSPKFALVEPDLDAGGTKRIANAFRRLGVLRGVA